MKTRRRRKGIAVLGSTGSVGTNTLRVIAAMKDAFEVVALAADSNLEVLAPQAGVFRPRIISVGNAFLAAEIKKRIPSGIRVAHGPEGLKEIVSRRDVDTAVFAISGSSCLIPLIHAVENKKRIALANKEALVSAGELIMRRAAASGAEIIPVDSEHSAIFQCLEGRREFLSKIYLTGSGGPLLNTPAKDFDRMGRRFILRHPKWRMGKKISVDSATMMNKGLEIIEATRLFGVSEGLVEVLIHPEAAIHSMVELADGSVFAQMGAPDMRLPIQYALTHPQRFKSMVKRLDFSAIDSLSFQRPDTARFPCLELARAAARSGGTAPAVLNAANEEAVRAYLKGAVRFSGIPRIIEKVLSRHRRPQAGPLTLGAVLKADGWAREEARSLCSR